MFAVWEVADAAVRRARSGQGPTLIECKTYRYFGHHQGDNPLRYRTAQEEETARARDCIKRFRAQVLCEKLLGESELEAIDDMNRALLQEAVKFAESSPLPAPEELYTNVYVSERG